MPRTLVIIPTKDRSEYINVFIQNLIEQPGEFDLFIADMSTDKNYLKDNWLFNKSLDRLYHKGHGWIAIPVEGANQLYGYQCGLQFAFERGYEFGVASDDDCVLGSGWLTRIVETMMKRPDASAIAGLTLMPWESEENQRCPDWFLDHPDHSGTLVTTDYYHATLIPPWKEPREYEQIFGPFMFRVRDFIEVGGFPIFLSPLGFRGEMWPMEACFFKGKKLLIDPMARCFHYSAFHGGLKALGNGEARRRYLEADKAEWDRFIMERRTVVRR